MYVDKNPLERYLESYGGVQALDKNQECKKAEKEIKTADQFQKKLPKNQLKPSLGSKPLLAPLVTNQIDPEHTDFIFAIAKKGGYISMASSIRNSTSKKYLALLKQSLTDFIEVEGRRYIPIIPQELKAKKKLSKKNKFAIM